MCSVRLRGWLGRERVVEAGRKRVLEECTRDVLAKKTHRLEEDVLRACLAALFAGMILLWPPASLIIRVTVGGVVCVVEVILGGGIFAEGRSALYSLLPVELKFVLRTYDG